MSKSLFGSVMLAGVLSSSIALAHVSLPSGPAQADKSGTKITFGISHGCEVGGVHYDTWKFRVEIPAGMTSVRALTSDFGRPVVTKAGTPAIATVIEWTRAPTDLLDDDDGYYEVSIRAKIPNTPFTRPARRYGKHRAGSHDPGCAPERDWLEQDHAPRRCGRRGRQARYLLR
jgi:hypothetical protein